MTTDSWQDQAAAAAADVAAIEAEIIELEAKKQKLELDASAAENAAADVLSSIGEAIFAGDVALKETCQKARAESERRAAEFKAAGTTAELRIQNSKVRLAEARRLADRARHLAARAAQLAALENVKPKLVEIISALSAHGNLHNLVADAFMKGAGRSDYAVQKIDELCTPMRAELERASAPPQQEVSAAPLLSDTAFVAFLPISYRGPEHGASEVNIERGWIGLVPSAVAKRADAAGAGSILPTPQRLQVTIAQTGVSIELPDAEGSVTRRELARGRTYTLDRDTALGLARSGKTEWSILLSPTDMTAYLNLHPNRAKRGSVVALGIVRDTDATGELVSGEIPPQSRADHDPARAISHKPSKKFRAQAALAGVQ